MNRRKTLIEEKSFTYEEFNVDSKVYKVILHDRYNRKNDCIYSIELDLNDTLSDETYSSNKTIKTSRIRSITWWESTLDVVNLFNKQLYDSMYDFIIDSVTTVARDARKERDEIKELKNQPNDVQADRAFESLQEI